MDEDDPAQRPACTRRLRIFDETTLVRVRAEATEADHVRMSRPEYAKDLDVPTLFDQPTPQRVAVLLAHRMQHVEA